MGFQIVFQIPSVNEPIPYAKILIQVIGLYILMYNTKIFDLKMTSFYYLSLNKIEMYLLYWNTTSYFHFVHE